MDGNAWKNINSGFPEGEDLGGHFGDFGGGSGEKVRIAFPRKRKLDFEGSEGQMFIDFVIFSEDPF